MLNLGKLSNSRRALRRLVRFLNPLATGTETSKSKRGGEPDSLRSNLAAGSTLHLTFAICPISYSFDVNPAWHKFQFLCNSVSFPTFEIQIIVSNQYFSYFKLPMNYHTFPKTMIGVVLLWFVLFLDLIWNWTGPIQCGWAFLFRLPNRYIFKLLTRFGGNDF